MDLTPKQQTSEAIRQAETILITTGSRPNVDQIASTLALAAILRKFGKKVSAIISDPLPTPAQWMDTKGMDSELSGLRDFIVKVNTSKVEVDSLRYEPDGDHLNIFIKPFQGGFSSSDVSFDYGEYQYDLAIILGVPQRNRIDRVYGEHPEIFGQIPVVNIDFHRINEGYGAINLIEPTASSISEMLVATSESLQSGLIDGEIGTIMLGGIMAATDRFTAPHTTSKSLTVAAQMMAAGADQQSVVRGLYGIRERDSAPKDRNSDSSNRPKRDGAAGPFPARTVTPPAPVAESPVKAAAVNEPVVETQEQPAEEVSLPHDMVIAHESAPVETIIEPDHMELMTSQMAHDEPASAELSATPAAEHIPMADFTAAAEILRQRDDEATA